MTDPTELFDYHSQCLSCNLSEGLVREIHDMHIAGWAYTDISRKLRQDHEISISSDALSNHLRFHARKPESTDTENEATPETLLGVVSPVKAPKGWEPKIEIGPEGGTFTTGSVEAGETPDFAKLIQETGENPEDYEWSIDKLTRYQIYSGDWRVSYKLNLLKKTPKVELDLPTLFAQVRAQDRPVTPMTQLPHSTRTLVVPFADLQAGKVGSRGDSKDLIERVTEKRYKLEEYVQKQNCAEAVFLDGGDVVESFENTAQQGFTNDLSIMDQLDLAGTLEQEFISMLASYHSKVTVAGVPSNHGAWRNGKDILGRPSDDWGLFLLKQIQKAYKLNTADYGHVEFMYPEEWRKSLNINVQGTGVGLVHGEDSSLAQMENWWAKQVHGASPVAESDILITNHYHTLGIKPSGRSLRTGKQKYWLATPTLDNGSDWWANKSGSDSDPGLMAFVVDSEIGLDLQSLTIL